MSDLDDDIYALLREVQTSRDVVRAFASYWIGRYRLATRQILAQHRAEGRFLAWLGEDPAPARDRAEERLAAARRELHGRLARLVAWARETGRAAP